MHLKASFDTEVFINTRGYLAIKQIQEFYHEPIVVELTREQAILIKKEISSLISQFDSFDCFIED